MTEDWEDKLLLPESVALKRAWKNANKKGLSPISGVLVKVIEKMVSVPDREFEIVVDEVLYRISKSFSDEDFERFLEKVRQERDRRLEKDRKLYMFLEIRDGIKKAWVAKVDEHKKIQYFIEPYSVIKEKEKGPAVKKYFLPPGTYLVHQFDPNKKRDKRHTLKVSEEDCTTPLPMSDDLSFPRQKQEQKIAKQDNTKNNHTKKWKQCLYL